MFSGAPSRCFCKSLSSFVFPLVTPCGLKHTRGDPAELFLLLTHALATCRGYVYSIRISNTVRTRRVAFMAAPQFAVGTLAIVLAPSSEGLGPVPRPFSTHAETSLPLSTLAARRIFRLDYSSLGHVLFECIKDVNMPATYACGRFPMPLPHASLALPIRCF